MHARRALAAAALLAVQGAAACQAFAPSNEGRVRFDGPEGNFGVTPTLGRPAPPPGFSIGPADDPPLKGDDPIRLPVDPPDAAADAAIEDAAVGDAGFAGADPDTARLDAAPDSN